MVLNIDVAFAIKNSWLSRRMQPLRDGGRGRPGGGNPAVDGTLQHRQDKKEAWEVDNLKLHMTIGHCVWSGLGAHPARESA
jgi:hypothetical protein